MIYFNLNIFQDFFNILNGYFGIYFMDEDLFLILNVFAPLNSRTINISEFCSVLFFSSDLLSSSPFLLSGSEIASNLLTDSLQCNALSMSSSSSGSVLPRTLSLPRVATTLNPTIAPSGRIRLSSVSVGIRMSKTVIFTVLSSICTSPESEEKLSSILEPFFNGDYSNEMFRNLKLKNSNQQLDGIVSINEGKIVTEKSISNVSDSEISDSNISIDEMIYERKSSREIFNEIDESVKTKKKNETEKEKARIEKELLELEISQSNRIAEILKNISLKNTEKETKSSTDSTEIILTEMYEKPYNSKRCDKVDSDEIGIKNTNNNEVPSNLGNDKPKDPDYSLEEIHKFLSQSSAVQILFDRELKNIIYQLINGSTKFSLETS